MTSFVSYLRLSTDRQKGNGLDAQRTAVDTKVAELSGELVQEFQERASGRCRRRPVLAEALAYCREHQATLVVGKLDRISRDAKLILELVDGQVPVVFCDVPMISPEPELNRFMLTIVAAFAELEAQRGRRRSREAYERRMADPVKADRCISTINLRKRLGHQRGIAAAVREVAAGLAQESGRVTVRGLAEALNAAQVPTLHGGQWHKESTARLINDLRLRAS